MLINMHSFNKQHMQKKNYSAIVLLLFFSQSFSQNYVVEYNHPKMKIAPVVPVKAYAFNISDVAITGGAEKTASPTACGKTSAAAGRDVRRVGIWGLVAIAGVVGVQMML